ncbi:MAG: hypothetical protein RIN56_15395 [Sporomusaceae bacterium]|nr:hypothetical protein [Sporomusaceae bacterium]
MKKNRDRRPMTVDAEHLRRLHLEACEQLDLLRTALEAADHASGTARDTLDDMAVDHWNGYLDVLHMITLHDDLMAAVLSKHGMSLRDSDSTETGQEYCGSRLPLLPLLSALGRRHRRFADVYGWRGHPMGDYLKESMTAEREHMAELIALIQDIL